MVTRAAEMRKHEKNDAKYTELGWICLPLAVESCGAWGVVACNAFSNLARREDIITNTEVLDDLLAG